MPSDEREPPQWALELATEIVTQAYRNAIPRRPILGNAVEVEAEALARIIADRAARSAPSPAPRWIPVEEKLPERGTDVLCGWLSSGKWLEYVGHRISFAWYNRSGSLLPKITHWMPLPAAPVSAGPEEEKK